MTDLTPTPALRPADGDIATDGIRFAVLPQRPITSIAPFDPVTAMALGFPAPGEVRGALVWAGRGMAFAFDTPAPEALGAQSALTDQSDGWVGFHLSGPDAVPVLARLVPIDCAALEGSARSLLGHHPLLIWRSGPEEFTLYTYRSMAESAAHEVETAINALKTRRALG